MANRFYITTPASSVVHVTRGVFDSAEGWESDEGGFLLGGRGSFCGVWRDVEITEKPTGKTHCGECGRPNPVKRMCKACAKAVERWGMTG